MGLSADCAQQNLQLVSLNYLLKHKRKWRRRWEGNRKFPKPAGTTQCSQQASFLRPYEKQYFFHKFPLLLHNSPYLSFSVTGFGFSIPFHSIPQRPWLVPEGPWCRNLTLAYSLRPPSSPIPPAHINPPTPAQQPLYQRLVRDLKSFSLREPCSHLQQHG